MGMGKRSRGGKQQERRASLRSVCARAQTPTFLLFHPFAIFWTELHASDSTSESTERRRNFCFFSQCDFLLERRPVS